MKEKKALVSWIGHTDIYAMCQDLPESEAEKIFQQAKIAPRKVDPPGPVKAAVQKISFEEIHLLSNYPKKVSQRYVKWLGEKATVHTMDLDEPSNYEKVFRASESLLHQLWQPLRKKKLQLHLHLSPGTPTMAAIWVLLGKSRYPATFIQTFREQLIHTEIPYDLIDDFLPELLKNSDLTLQHLAAKAPEEISGFEDIVGKSQAISLAVGRAQRAALRDVPVLILGESGTGKEMFARAIHKASRRREGPFIPINCAAIPRDLLESELFGHVKGAFTGATEDRKGAFSRADGGTLFLDEIGECDPDMQSKLLRVLQPPPNMGPCCRELTPVGGAKSIQTDVRIVAATNKDLHKEIQQNRFREDLYYRIAVIPLHLPPLRERKKDIPLIADALLEKINTEFREQDQSHKDKSISAGTKSFVKEYAWPGNVRQLYNAIVRAAVMAEGDVLERHDLAEAVAEMPERIGTNVMEHPLGDGFSLKDHLDGIQRHFLQRAMTQAAGVKAEAARLLGIDKYQTLDAQLKRLGVEE